MHVVLVHGWKGWPDNAWFPWLRRALIAKGFTVESLKLPNSAIPDRKQWVRLVHSAIKGPDTILVGHSLGCPTMLFALEQYDGPPIEQVVCVSGFARDFKILGLDRWFDHTAIDFVKVKNKAKRWTVLHGKKDYVVPLKEGQWLAEQLGVPVTFTKRSGHLTHEELAFDLPEVLEVIVGTPNEHVR